MAWNCQQTEDRLLDALDGALGGGERAEMEAHTASCARCAELVEGVRRAVGTLASLEAVEPGPGLVEKIVARTSGRPAEKRRRTGWLDFLTQPRFAMGLVAVLITLSIVFRALSGGAPTALAAVNPLEFYRQADRRAHLVYARSVKFLSDLRVVYEIQSRFAPANSEGSSTTPEKKSTDQIQRLFYDRLESRLRPAANIPNHGDSA
jgi:anti-sigma factor RsiW